ncbi:MAG: aspartate:alanine exchanger family transporter [Corynebacterium glucuronolyticum]|nr:transporter [Corynebacterium glucuronolyticum]MDD7587410.1 aspartate:alanine exchanger family transporter [Mycobacteriaceae bacterium]MDY5834119.1 aspartate:alanine exchanger family transporter [Corynebacterium glucuronolyticum]
MDFFVDNPLFTLVVIMAVGLLLGRINFFGIKLGVAAVLFVGLGFATLVPDIELPPLLYNMGLTLFVYTIGLEFGPSFFHTLRTTGWKLNVFLTILLALITVVTFGGAVVLGFGPDTAGGIFTGALVNTPALAAVVESVNSSGIGNPQVPVVAYSLTYPIGVLGVIIMFAIFQRIFRVDYAQEADEAGLTPHELEHWQIEVEVGNLPPVDDIPEIFDLAIIVTRIRRGKKEILAGTGDRPRLGDVLTIAGAPDELKKAERIIGTFVSSRPNRNKGLDYDRLVVTDESAVGLPLAELKPKLPGVLISRVKHGDDDQVARPDMVLHLGDRIRIVSTPENREKARRFFGDSYSQAAALEMLPLLSGLILGLLVGMIAIPLPGGVSLKLGSAGGPLVVGVILGAVSRTGRFVWHLPYAAGRILKEFGLTLFLAGIGTTAGAGFASALQDPTSLRVIGFGAAITMGLAATEILFGYKVLKIPYGTLTGFVSALHTHPALLSYASDQARNDMPGAGYAMVYPMAMIAKIVCAQALFFLLV